MKPKYVYLGLAGLLLVIGMFMSAASVAANVAIAAMLTLCLAASLAYALIDRANDTCEDKADRQSNENYLEIARLSRAMRNEPDPERYAAMRVKRDDLAQMGRG